MTSGVSSSSPSEASTSTAEKQPATKPAQGAGTGAKTAPSKANQASSGQPKAGGNTEKSAGTSSKTPANGSKAPATPSAQPMFSAPVEEEQPSATSTASSSSVENKEEADNSSSAPASETNSSEQSSSKGETSSLQSGRQPSGYLHGAGPSDNNPVMPETLDTSGTDTLASSMYGAMGTLKDATLGEDVDPRDNDQAALYRADLVKVQNAPTGTYSPEQVQLAEKEIARLNLANDAAEVTNLQAQGKPVLEEQRQSLQKNYEIVKQDLPPEIQTQIEETLWSTSEEGQSAQNRLQEALIKAQGIDHSVPVHGGGHQGAQRRSKNSKAKEEAQQELKEAYEAYTVSSPMAQKIGAPPVSDMLSNQALSLAQQGHKDAALKALENAQAYYDDHEAGQEGAVSPQEFDQKIQIAEANIEAIDQVLKAQSSIQNNIETITRAHVEGDDPEEAMNNLEKAVQDYNAAQGNLQPGDEGYLSPDVLLMGASQQYLDAGEYQQAQKFAQKALAYNPGLDKEANKLIQSAEEGIASYNNEKAGILDDAAELNKDNIATMQEQLKSATPSLHHQLGFGKDYSRQYEKAQKALNDFEQLNQAYLNGEDVSPHELRMAKERAQYLHLDLMGDNAKNNYETAMVMADSARTIRDVSVASAATVATMGAAAAVAGGGLTVAAAASVAGVGFGAGAAASGATLGAMYLSSQFYDGGVQSQLNYGQMVKEDILNITTSVVFAPVGGQGVAQTGRAVIVNQAKGAILEGGVDGIGTVLITEGSMEERLNAGTQAVATAAAVQIATGGLGGEALEEVTQSSLTRLLKQGGREGGEMLVTSGTAGAINYGLIYSETGDHKLASDSAKGAMLQGAIAQGTATNMMKPAGPELQRIQQTNQQDVLQVKAELADMAMNGQNLSPQLQMYMLTQGGDPAALAGLTSFSPEHFIKDYKNFAARQAASVAVADDVAAVADETGDVAGSAAKAGDAMAPTRAAETPPLALAQTLGLEAPGASGALAGSVNTTPTQLEDLPGLGFWANKVRTDEATQALEDIHTLGAPRQQLFEVTPDGTPKPVDSSALSPQKIAQGMQKGRYILGGEINPATGEAIRMPETYVAPKTPDNPEGVDWEALAATTAQMAQYDAAQSAADPGHLVFNNIFGGFGRSSSSKQPLTMADIPRLYKRIINDNSHILSSCVITQSTQNFMSSMLSTVNAYYPHLNQRDRVALMMVLDNAYRNVSVGPNTAVYRSLPSHRVYEVKDTQQNTIQVVSPFGHAHRIRGLFDPYTNGLYAPTQYVHPGHVGFHVTTRFNSPGGEYGVSQYLDDKRDTIVAMPLLSIMQAGGVFYPSKMTIGDHYIHFPGYPIMSGKTVQQAAPLIPARIIPPDEYERLH
jgi:tetratricopeptide (TPR) repeat protein